MNGEVPKTPEEFVRVAYPLLQQVHQGMYGVPDTDEKGLCGKVEAQGKELFSLKRAFWTLVGILVGSGVLGVGAYGIIKGG
jgi:hypothetical protein